VPQQHRVGDATGRPIRARCVNHRSVATPTSAGTAGSVTSKRSVGQDGLATHRRLGPPVYLGGQRVGVVPGAHPGVGQLSATASSRTTSSTGAAAHLGQLSEPEQVVTPVSVVDQQPGGAGRGEQPAGHLGHAKLGARAR